MNTPPMRSSPEEPAFQSQFGEGASFGMPRRALGATGIVAPVLGFGVSGPLASLLVSSGHVHKLVRNASEQGVEFFDTAPFYGNGRAETRLREALHAIPERNAYISTKGGTRRMGNQFIKDFTIEGLRSQLEESRRRLGRIDAFFLHGPAPEMLTPKLFSDLAALKSKGCFDHLGVAGRGAELDAAVDGGVDLIMAPAHKHLNPVDLDRLERARAHGVGVIGIESLAPAARGARLSLRPADLWYTARALLRRNSPRPEQDDANTPAECLTWTLNSGLVDIVLITTTRLRNLASNTESVKNLCGAISAV